MNTAESKDGTKIAYDKSGSGPALIYVTGAICHRKFKPVLEDVNAFAKVFTVYCYDRRGRGDSGDNGSYAPEKELDDIEAIIKATGEKPYIYGHSSGAVLTLEAALRFPEKIRKIAVYDPPYAQDENDRKKNYAFSEDIDRLVAKKKYFGAIKYFLSGIGMPKTLIYLMPLMPGWSRIKALAPTLRYDMILTRDLPPLERLAGMKVPVLLMYGAKNSFGFAAIVEKLAQMIPGSKVEKFADYDHMVSAKALVPKLRAFFEE